MIERAHLEAAARDRGIDPCGLIDREVALVLLTAEGIAIDEPHKLGSAITIRHASDEHIDRRLDMVLSQAPVSTGTLGLSAALAYVRRAGLALVHVDLVDAIDDGQLAYHLDAQHQTRIERRALDAYIARHRPRSKAK